MARADILNSEIAELLDEICLFKYLLKESILLNDKIKQIEIQDKMNDRASQITIKKTQLNPFAPNRINITYNE